MRVLYLCGAGNSEGIRLALAVNEKKNRWDRIIMLDDDPAKHGRTLLGVIVEGGFEILAHPHGTYVEVANMIARSTSRRLCAQRKIESYGLPFARMVHPSVDVRGAELDDDVLVFQNAVIGPEVSIGKSSVVFMSAVIGHESHLGRYCVMAPGAIINARIHVGDGTYIGTNASVLPEVQIGDWAVIGAGTVAMRDVPAGATLMGVPGKIVWRVNPEMMPIENEQAV